MSYHSGSYISRWEREWRAAFPLHHVVSEGVTCAALAHAGLEARLAPLQPGELWEGPVVHPTSLPTPPHPNHSPSCTPLQSVKVCIYDTQPRSGRRFRVTDAAAQEVSGGGRCIGVLYVIPDETCLLPGTTLIR